MTAPTRADLADATLVKDWYLDVDSGYPGTESWIAVGGLMKFKPETPATFKDAGTFEGGGWGSQQKTAAQWKLSMQLKRAPQSSALTDYDEGQEVLRAASRLFGASNRVHVRWYEANDSGPVTEAWEGYANVEWTEANDAIDDIRVIDVTLQGQGAPIAVAPNPASA